MFRIYQLRDFSATRFFFLPLAPSALGAIHNKANADVL